MTKKAQEALQFIAAVNQLDHSIHNLQKTGAVPSDTRAAHNELALRRGNGVRIAALIAARTTT